MTPSATPYPASFLRALSSAKVIAMAILDLHRGRAGPAHQPTTPVPLDADGRPSDEVVGLIDDMYETMDAAHGVGLAANQVGVGKRY